MSIKFEQRKVGPEEAGKIMDRHWARIEKLKFKQRPISLTRILRYAQAMRDGQWGLSPEPITFDTNDDLIEGQHRLESVRKSGVTVEFTISTGWPPETLDLCGQGWSRTPSAILALKNGYGGYAGRYAGAISTFSRIVYRGSSAACTFANTEYMLEKLGLKDNIDAVMTKSPNQLKDFTSLVTGPLAYYHTVKPGKALQFADSLFNFETVKGSPVNLYLNWIKSGRWQAQEAGKGVHTSVRKLAGMCACLRAWDTNNQITRVVTSVDVIDWLADQNPKLRDWIRAHVLRSHGGGMEKPGVSKAAAK